METSWIPRLETLPEKKLLGKRLRMSFADNRTAELWRSFMPRRREIESAVGSSLFSVQTYDASVSRGFRPDTLFEKWAAVEVSTVENIPEGMEPFVLPGGLYAVFAYRGSASDTTIFRYIFETWLPASGYRLDNRPHFEILGEKYKGNAPDSEEDIYIPIAIGTIVI